MVTLNSNDYCNFLVIAITVAEILIAAFWVIRAIENRYRCRETKYESMLEKNLQDRELKVGYQYNQRLAQSVLDKTNFMAMNIVKEINDKRCEATKSMMGDATNFAKDLMKAFEEIAP